MARRALALRAAPSRLQEPAGSAHLPAGSPRPARPDPWVVMAGHDRRPIGAPATAVQAELIRRSCGTLGSLSGARERAVRQSDHRTGLVNPRDSCGSPGSRSPPSATPTPASQEPHRRAARPHARSQPPALAALTDARRARASRPLHACRPPGSARTQKPRNARAGAAATRGSGPEEIKQLTPRSLQAAPLGGSGRSRGHDSAGAGRGGPKSPQRRSLRRSRRGSRGLAFRRIP